MQDGVDILTEAIAAYLADNSNMPPQEAIRKLFSKENAARLAQTAAESAKTFAYGMLPAAGIKAAGAGWSVRQVQKTPQAQRAEALNNWHAAQSHKGNGEQAGLGDVVFIPAEVFQQFNQGAADEQIGADETVTVESTGEVMMSRAAYEKLAAENEEFAKATASKVRIGAFGRTFEENAKILRESETDPLNDPNDEWAHEAREIRDEITQEMKDAGFDDATSEAAGTIYAKNRLVRAVWLGTDELGIRRDGAKSPKQLRRIEIDNQRVQSERAEAEFQQNAYQKHGMKETMRKWAGVVNEAFDGKAPSDRKTVKVMDTPLVFDLLGGSFSDINGDRIPVTMDSKKIYNIAHGLGQHEHYLSREDMKQIPRAMADPIAVFEAKSNRKGSEYNGLVFMLDITDTNGSTVIAAVHMQLTSDGVEIHKLASYYGKDKLVGEKVIPRDTWFSEEIKDGRLMYMNTKKASHWETQHDLLLLAGSVSNGRLFDDPSIKTEADLVKLRRENPTFNQPFNQEAEQNAQTPLVRDGITRKPDDTQVQVIHLKNVPDLSGKKIKDILPWIKETLQSGGDIIIRSTGQRARFTTTNIRASLKRTRDKMHNEAYAALREMVELAEYSHSEKADERHTERTDGQDIYTSALEIGGKLYSVESVKYFV